MTLPFPFTRENDLILKTKMLQKDCDSFKLIYPEGWKWDSREDLDEPPTINFEQWSLFSKAPATCRIKDKPSASSVFSIADTPRFAAPLSESAVQQARKAAVPKSTQMDKFGVLLPLDGVGQTT